MSIFKRVITILGVVALVVVAALLVAALWAINKREDNYAKVARATAGRWKPKEQPNENAEPAEMVASPGSGGDNGLDNSESIASGS